MTNSFPTPLADPVRITDLGDLVAGLPVLFGFRPEHSLVVVCVEGRRGRVGFRLRVDLPPADLCDEVAGYLVDVLRRNDARAVFVIACSDDSAAADPVVSAVRRRLRSAGVVVRDAVRCDGRRYWSYVCDDPACCPPEGKPYDADSSRLVAEAVLAGVEMLPDRAALAARVGPVGGGERDRMEAATARASADLLALSGDAEAAARQRDRALAEEGVRRVRRVVDTAVESPDRPLSPEDVATLAVWCSLTVVRDMAVAWIDTDNASDHVSVWTAAARMVVPPHEVRVLGLAGFSAWLSGDGALAWCAVERAIQVDPDDTFVGLLREALIGATPPSMWVPPTEERIWQSVDRDC
jgi:Domain of unknown function (DUF4192)